MVSMCPKGLWLRVSRAERAGATLWKALGERTIYTGQLTGGDWLKLTTKTTHYQYPQIKWLLRVQFGNHQKPWTACPTRWRFSKDIEDSVIGTYPFSFLSFFCPDPHGTNRTVTLWVVGSSLLRANSIVCTILFKWESQWFFTFNLKILLSLRSQSQNYNMLFLWFN